MAWSTVSELQNRHLYDHLCIDFNVNGRHRVFEISEKHHCNSLWLSMFAIMAVNR